MGSCISKCIPSKEKAKENEQEANNNNEAKDKGIVSQVLVMHDEMLPPHLRTSTTSQQPRSPPASSSNSLASFSSTTEKSVSSSASSLSSTSSFPILKDKSFSNEFLLSCVKENPQVMISRKKTNVQVYTPSSLAKVEKQKAKVVSVSNHSQRKTVVSTPLKRICPSSPNQTRPKRINHMRPQSPMRTPSPSRRYLNNDDLRNHTIPQSPSPSRRFVNNDNRYNSLYNYQRKANNKGTSFYFEKEKEPIRKLSPSTNHSKTKNGSSTCKQTCTYRVGSKIDEFEVAKAMTKQDLDVEMEGIDNPVITLDCFIFL